MLWNVCKYSFFFSYESSKTLWKVSRIIHWFPVYNYLLWLPAAVVQFVRFAAGPATSVQKKYIERLSDNCYKFAKLVDMTFLKNYSFNLSWQTKYLSSMKWNMVLWKSFLFYQNHGKFRTFNMQIPRYPILFWLRVKLHPPHYSVGVILIQRSLMGKSNDTNPTTPT